MLHFVFNDNYKLDKRHLSKSYKPHTIDDYIINKDGTIFSIKRNCILKPHNRKIIANSCRLKRCIINGYVFSYVPLEYSEILNRINKSPIYRYTKYATDNTKVKSK